MAKVANLDKLTKILKESRRLGKTIGLVTGCFDVIHVGHIELFQFARDNVDIVVIGVDNDESIKISKGDGRPIFGLNHRLRVLSELASIDWVFPIEGVFHFDSDRADEVHDKILKKTKPHFLITNPGSDRFWKKKSERARAMGARLLSDTRRRSHSTAKIVRRLESEL